MSTQDPALRIVHAGITAAHSGTLIRETFTGTTELASTLRHSRSVSVVSVGKAAHPMAHALRELAGPRFADGIAVGPHAFELPGFEVHTGEHPVPSTSSARSGRALLHYLHREYHPQDTVVFAISGGASALIATPIHPLDVQDLSDLTHAMLRSGIDASRINQIRRQISAVHGGKLLHHCGDAHLIGVVLCDNIQNGARDVGSGISYPDTADPSVSRAVLDELTPHISPALRARVRQALSHATAHTVSTAIDNVVIGGPWTAHSAAIGQARADGRVVIDAGSAVQGDARATAQRFIDLAHTWIPRHPTGCIIGTGEVTVTVQGRGRGGRCQEMAAALIEPLSHLPTAAFAAVASDGCDFDPEAMGALIDSDSLTRVRSLGLSLENALADNDTFPLLDAIGSILKSQVTDTNVCDLYVLTWG